MPIVQSLLVRIAPSLRFLFVFYSSKQEARSALERFLPRAGLDYARARNFDYGLGRRENVSMLSPWVRLRMLPEWELIAAVLQHHSVSEAAKFIDEVCWRTYWKGWLSRRPTVWQDYCAELAAEQASLPGQSRYHALVSAASGIDCMDGWTRELIDTGYLHNHARMWYASIWIHTLKLPWTLGADFFFRHLLDGDPASNTLSWRWVAGLHTEGKTYLATADNIRQYSDGGLNPQIQFATDPADVSRSARNPLAAPHRILAPLPDADRVGLLLNEEDLSARNWLGGQAKVSAIAGFIPQQSYQTQRIAQPVFDFRYNCMRDALDGSGAVYTQLDAVVAWAEQANIDVLLMAEPSIGIWNQVLPELQHALRNKEIQLVCQRPWWDDHFYPHAQAGFFRFKKAIPAAIQQLNRASHL
ncbi:MAG: deoxyribodipyrimidine photo-lyase [Bacteroidia bacterium]|jgi:deoxyribodipyrimidine photo-lyase